MHDHRAVSTALGYTLTLAIAATLVTGLLVAGGNYVDDRREQVIRNELTVVGQQIVSDLMRADRLVVAADSSTPTVEISQQFPDRVTGSTYQITLDPSRPAVVLRSARPEISVSVSVQTETPLADTAADGGVVQIAYDSGSLEVQDV